MSMMSLYRPLSRRELFQWTVRIYVRHWPQWFALAALGVVPALLIGVVLAYLLPMPLFDEALLEQFLAPLESGSIPDDPALQQAMTAQLFSNSLVMLAQLVGQVLTQIVIMGTIVGGGGAVMAAAAYREEAVSVRAAVQRLVERAKLLFTGHVIVAVLLIVLLVSSMIGLMICVGIIGLGFSVYVYLAWVPLLAPFLALGEGKLSDLLRQTWTAGKAQVWLILSMVVTMLGARFVLAFPFEMLAGMLVPDSIIGTLIISMLVEVLVLPFGAIFFTLIYEEQQASKQADLTPGLPGLEPDHPPAAVEHGPILTPADLPNIVGISMVSLALLFGFYLLLSVQLMFAL